MCRDRPEGSCYTLLMVLPAYTRGNKMNRQLKGTDRSYGIIGINRKNSKSIAGLVKAAVKNGHSWLRLELCGKGSWNGKELKNLRNGLDELGEFLIKEIMKNREFYLVNMEEVMDTDEGCRMFSNMLLADSRGNYVLVSPQWRYDGRGVKLGSVDSGIKKYHDCTYERNSAKCAECERKNLEDTGRLYDGKATAEFDRGIRKILENIKYLGKSKSVFKTYLDKLLEDKEKESGLLINENR